MEQSVRFSVGSELVSASSGIIRQRLDALHRRVRPVWFLSSDRMLKGRALRPIGRRTKKGEATLPKRSRLQHRCLTSLSQLIHPKVAVRDVWLTLAILQDVHAVFGAR